MFKTKKEAFAVVGGLSNPSKMPCYGYSIPASRCKMGSLMSRNPDSICGKCYAKKNMYTFPAVQAALERRYQSLQDPRWVEAMAFLIKSMPYFRWHDSGDIQDIRHLLMIVEVAKLTPKTIHWLPTREYGIVKQYVENYAVFPPNLTVRLSGGKFDGSAPVALAKRLGVVVSGASATDYNCPASHQNNECKDCRMCWQKNVFQVNYHKH